MKKREEQNRKILEKAIKARQKELKERTKKENVPRLSPEETDAMYERFCSRLRECCMMDETGNPTQETERLAKNILEQENQLREMERMEFHQNEKRKQRTAHRKRAVRQTLKAAGLVVIAAGCVFGITMTSQANRIRLVESVQSMWNTGDKTLVNNGEDRKYSADDLEMAVQEIANTLHVRVPEFYYLPKGMEYSHMDLFSEIQYAMVYYKYENSSVYFTIEANDNDLSRGDWKDNEKVTVETLDGEMEVQLGTKDSDSGEKQYFASWSYMDAHYELCGQISREELLKILQEMHYSL